MNRGKTASGEEALPTEQVPTLARLLDVLRTLTKVLIFAVSLLLFVFGILGMKDGARALAPLIQQYLRLSHPLNSFGIGWLWAMLIMSGSPVAAISLTFLDANLLTPLSAFTMIMGSRFGASFIVLCIGFLYVLRGRDLLTSLGMGLLSFGVTISLHLLGIVPGLSLLRSGTLQGVPRPSGATLMTTVDRFFQPVIAGITAFLPHWMLFVLGLIIIMVSFALFDRCLPTQTIKKSELGKVARYVYRPWVMFLLGFTVTLISMSVSLSISILVPLNDRGLVRRENVIPYIMGANVTTFVDTLLASLLMSSPVAFDVVLAEMASIALAAMLILTFTFHRYEHLMQGFVEWVTSHPRHLLFFLFLLFAIPLSGLWV